jgi:iron-sulfur cluster assembly protein
MKDILSITDNAASQIKKIISKADTEVIGVVVGVDKTGCSGYAYKLDYVKDENLENFEKIESKGVKVFIEPSATMFLIGSEMDYATDKIASRFIFNNPNEKSSCGCGESFNI